MEAALLDDAPSEHFPSKPLPPPRVGLGDSPNTAVLGSPAYLPERAFHFCIHATAASEGSQEVRIILTTILQGRK